MKNKKYFKCRNNNYYTKYTREEIYSKIIPENFDTCIPFLQDMNYPAFKKEYQRRYEYCLKNNINTKYAFSKYIAYMRLKGFEALTFKDSNRFDF